MIERVAVFCGSRPGNQVEFAAAARSMGEVLAKKHVGLVYGGGRLGLMGELADAVLAAGGEVTGVIPQALVDRELAHAGVTKLEVVGSMHERKARIAELADAFIALPGGLGTLEELFEVWTWGQLGLHRKPVGLLNTGGFYDFLVAMVEHMVAQGFVQRPHREMLSVHTEPSLLLDAIDHYNPPPVRQWIERDQT